MRPVSGGTTGPWNRDRRRQLPSTGPGPTRGPGGSQPVPFAALDATSIEITIESDYPAEVVEEERFTEMAIQEIRSSVALAASPTGPTEPPDDNPGHGGHHYRPIAATGRYCLI